MAYRKERKIVDRCETVTNRGVCKSVHYCELEHEGERRVSVRYVCVCEKCVRFLVVKRQREKVLRVQKGL